MFMSTMFDVARAAEPAAARPIRSRAADLVPALLACLALASRPAGAVAAPFQQYANASCAVARTYCAVDFASVPAGKRLEIDDVSCHLRMTGAHEISLMALTINGNETSIAGHIVVLAPEFVGGIGRISAGAAPKGSLETIYAASHSIFAYASEGEHFRAAVEFTAGGVGQFACHISGQMLDGPG